MASLRQLTIDGTTRLHIINLATGGATQVGAAFAATLRGVAVLSRHGRAIARRLMTGGPSPQEPAASIVLLSAGLPR